MAGRLVFLLEEPSMRVLLEGWLPRLFPGWVSGEHFLCVPHEGKSDLDRSIARKLAAWRYPGDRFVIVRDNDNADCIDLKARLRRRCEDAGRPDSLIRLVCQELESWYLGDLAALAAAFDTPRIDSPANRKRFDAPDSWQKPSVEVKRLIPAFQKIGGARAMAAHLEAQRNRSPSLRAFVAGVRRLNAEAAG
ncbi:DUF4276 family protein [Pseudacidovorax intermedius]|uniref:DUF4276 family protein n=1 Tax=Pseudacidovorax intermedius TaxID=433924 RepID=UPI0026F32A07|nr:DUF4276 family protein [Pseudacidovorax intermedius]